MFTLIAAISSVVILLGDVGTTAASCATPPALVIVDDGPVVEPPSTTTRPDTRPDTPITITETAADNPVDELLSRLEHSAESLRAFTADVVYQAEDALIGRTETRRGELIYAFDPATDDKRFAVLFNTIDRNGRRETRQKHYIFDGQWLAEIDTADREFIKRQIVPPGERLDPLKLGEGPFPLPVGQPREQVLARFDVSLLNLPSGGPLAPVSAAYEELEGLLLIPRAGTAEADEYERVELLYDSITLLPVGINVVELSGDRKTVRLRNPRRNPVLDQKALDKLRIEEPDPRDWAVSVQPWTGGQ